MESKIHEEWKQSALTKLSAAFKERTTNSGFDSAMWILISDSLTNNSVEGDFDSLISGFSNIPENDLKKNVLNGALHYENIVDEIMKGEINLYDAIKKLPVKKYEWLSYIGLYPYNPDKSIIKGLELLINSPFEFKKIASELINEFWSKVFADTWENLSYKFITSSREKHRLLVTSDLGELFRNLYIPVEVDKKKNIIKALRGGYELSLGDINTLYFIPSAFNYKRSWTTYPISAGKTNAYFAYFDAAISLDFSETHTYSKSNFIDLDPALVLKALGDLTRFSMVASIFKKPMSSVQLAKMLGVSKATISHHVYILREAGLINECFENGSVILSLKVEVIENLSALIMSKLSYK